MAPIFDPSREFYQLKNDGALEALLADSRDLIGADEFDQYDSPATGEAIRDALDGETQISLSGFVKLFERLKTTGRIKTNDDLDSEAAEEESEEEEIVAGPTLTEHESFYKTHTAQQIRERIRTDKPFAEFARAQMAGEVQQADGVGQNVPVTREPHPALKKFANNFNQSSRAELRPKGGYVTVGDEKFTVQKFNELVDQATSAGLL